MLFTKYIRFLCILVLLFFIILAYFIVKDGTAKDPAIYQQSVDSCPSGQKKECSYSTVTGTVSSETRGDCIDYQETEQNEDTGSITLGGCKEYAVVKRNIPLTRTVEDCKCVADNKAKPIGDPDDTPPSNPRPTPDYDSDYNPPIQKDTWSQVQVNTERSSLAGNTKDKDLDDYNIQPYDFSGSQSGGGNTPPQQDMSMISDVNMNESASRQVSDSNPDSEQNLTKYQKTINSISDLVGVDQSQVVYDSNQTPVSTNDPNATTTTYTPQGTRSSNSKKDKRTYANPLPTPPSQPQFVINTNWNSNPIPSLTMPDGTTGFPSAQAEVFLGKIPVSTTYPNHGLILQTVVMESNNKSYNRWAKVNLTTGSTDWGAFSSPIDLSEYGTPVPSNGVVNALGLTLASQNKIISTIFVNNTGYTRLIDFTINSDATASLINAQPWQNLQLPGIVSEEIQAYDYAYFSHYGGFYLETYVANNNFYHRFLPASTSLENIFKRVGTTQWYGPLEADSLQGTGRVLTYSYYVINDKKKLSQAIWKTSGGYFRDLFTTSIVYPAILPVNLAWQGSINSLTMPGNIVGKPAAQAEVYLGKIPGQNKGLIYQSVVMEANNKSYNRYGTIDLATGITQWGTFEGPIDFSVYKLPSNVVGKIKGLGLTFVPGNKLVQTVIINNKGYSRTLNYSLSSAGSVSFPNPNNNWVEIPLSGLITGDIQAYDLAYFGQDGGYYLETVAINNTLYYRMFRPNSDYSNVVSKEGVLPWSPVVFPATSLPGTGDLLTYSYFVINEKDKISQAFWKNSGGYFRDLRASSINYYDYSDLVSTDKFDVNNDKKQDILDVITAIKVVFNNQPSSKSIDVNGDGKENILDAILIIKTVFGSSGANN